MAPCSPWARCLAPWLVGLSISVSGCARTYSGLLEGAGGSGGAGGTGGSGGSALTTWVVTVVEDRLAGPVAITTPSELDPDAEGLSLREAILFANHSEGPNRIEFSPEVFDPAQPATIVLESLLPLVVGSDLEIDGSGAGVIIDASAAPGATVASLVIFGHRVRVSSLRWIKASLAVIGGADVTIADQEIEGTGAVYAAQARRARFERVRFPQQGLFGLEESVESGVYDCFVAEGLEGAIVAIMSSAIEIIGNEVSLGAKPLISVANSTEVLISHNTVMIGDKGAQRGIQLFETTFSEVLDNFVDPGEAHLINLTDSPDNLVARNILDGGDAGIVIEGASPRVHIFQNIIMNQVYDGIYVANGSSDVTVIHNSIWQASAPLVLNPPDIVEANNLVDSPDWADPDNYDFRLLGGPAVDAGEDLGQDCLPGQPERYLGDGFDLGAVESM